MLHFWVYILRCSDGSYYTGHTDNLEVRLAQHQSGQGGDYTSRRRPVTLVWSEALPTRIEALEAERRVKPWSRAKKEGLIAGDGVQVSYFSRPPHERPSTTLGTNGGVEQQTVALASGEGSPERSQRVETRSSPSASGGGLK